MEEWSWYEKYIVNYYLHDLKLAGRFTPAQIHRAIGLINVNAVALKFPMNATSESKNYILQIQFCQKSVKNSAQFVNVSV